MEAAVIDKITGMAGALADKISTQTDDAALYLPQGASLVKAEQYDAAPRFHRHHYSTERLSDFIGYARHATFEATANPTVYVLPAGIGALAVFDHGTPADPQWGHHRATLALKETPAWKAAQLTCCAMRTQQQVIDWLEDWAPNITAHAQNGDLIEARRAIAALRRVKLEAKGTLTQVEGDFNRQKSTLESIEASGDGDALPGYFVLHTPIYIGTVEHEIVIRLGVREADGKAMFALRVVGIERLAEATSAWIEKQMGDELGNALSVYVGMLEVGKP